MRLASLFVLLSLLNLSCAGNFKVRDFSGYITTPGRQKGFGVAVISGKETEVPAKEWAEMLKRCIHLPPEEWAKLKLTILENCHFNQCKQIAGALDELYLALDKQLQKLPVPSP